MFAKVSYYRYSGSNSVTVAPGGTDAAQTFIMPNPASVITGVLYGATGETLNAQTEGNDFRCHADERKSMSGLAGAFL